MDLTTNFFSIRFGFDSEFGKCRVFLCDVRSLDFIKPLMVYEGVYLFFDSRAYALFKSSCWFDSFFSDNDQWSSVYGFFELDRSAISVLFSIDVVFDNPKSRDRTKNGMSMSMCN